MSDFNPISTEEALKIKLSKEISESVETKLIKRYTWLGIIYGIVIGSLITLTVQVTLNSATKKLNVGAELQNKITEKAFAVNETIEEAGVKIAKTNEEITALRIEVESILKARETNSKRSFNLTVNNADEIKKIHEILEKIGRNNSAVTSKVLELKESISTTQNEIREAQQTAALTKYPITLSNYDNVTNLKDKFENLGFVTKLTPEKSDRVKSIGIRIATQLPPSYAKLLIRESVKELPIKYIYMGDFVGNENTIFIGKYSARQKQYPAMTNEFINDLLNTDDSQLYSKIREYYKN
jgi:tetrahydromethanopterin S-methyltransferase subunit G